MLDNEHLTDVNIELLDKLAFVAGGLFYTEMKSVKRIRDESDFEVILTKFMVTHFLSSDSPLRIGELVEARNIDRLQKCMKLLSSVMETTNRLLDLEKDNVGKRRKDYDDLSDVFEKLFKVYT